MGYVANKTRNTHPIFPASPTKCEKWTLRTLPLNDVGNFRSVSNVNLHLNEVSELGTPSTAPFMPPYAPPCPIELRILPSYV